MKLLYQSALIHFCSDLRKPDDSFPCAVFYIAQPSNVPSSIFLAVATPKENELPESVSLVARAIIRKLPQILYRTVNYKWKESQTEEPWDLFKDIHHSLGNNFFLTCLSEKKEKEFDEYHGTIHHENTEAFRTEGFAFASSEPHYLASPPPSPSQERCRAKSDWLSELVPTHIVNRSPPQHLLDA